MILSRPPMSCVDLRCGIEFTSNLRKRIIIIIIIIINKFIGNYRVAFTYSTYNIRIYNTRQSNTTECIHIGKTGASPPLF